jgi:hypothetical protein
MFFIEVTFIGEKDYSLSLLFLSPNISSSLSLPLPSTLKQSFNSSYENTGFNESLFGWGILKICFGHCPN